jgi:hypothetical protein
VAPLLALLHNWPYQGLYSFRSPADRRYVEVLVETFRNL